MRHVATEAQPHRARYNLKRAFNLVGVKISLPQ